MKDEYIRISHIIIDKLSEYRSYLYCMAALLVSYFAKVHTTNLFGKIAEIVKDCSQPALAIGICCLVLSLGSFLLLGIFERKKYIAHRTVAVALYLVVVYLYYRIIDKHFVFWGLPPYFAWMDLLLIPFVLLLIEKRLYHKASKSSDGDCQILCDSPIDDFNVDAFGHRQIITTMLDNLDSLDLSKGAYSVGIVGEWGQGKSSFLNLFCNSIKNGIVVRFNPRSVNCVDRIQEEFFTVFSDELCKYHTGVKRYVRQYATAIEAADDGWVGKLANILAFLTADEQKERINTAIEKIGRKVYVIVEDLDRLTGQEIIEVLKLIDGNGDFSNTIFMTAYDKRYVNEVLKNYLAPSVTQDYTDKYFNYEYILPTPSRFALKSFFSNYLSDNLKQVEGDLLTQKQIIEVWDECSDYVVRILRTMRHIKRFINLFMSRYTKLKNDVDLKDYIYVTLLRYTDIRTYSAICEGRLLVRGSIMNGSNKILYQSDNAKKVLEALGAKESSTEIINFLFPEKGSEGTLEETYNRAKWADNTDRYFYDYKVVSLPYAKGNKLFTIEDDKDAFALVDEYLNEGYSQPLSDFLRSRRPSIVGSADGLCRLTKLIVYLNKKDRTSDLDGYLNRLMYDIGFKDYDSAGVIKDRTLYKNVVDTALMYMLDFAPLEIGYACIRMINGLIEKQILEDGSVFTKDELIQKAEWAQKYYLQKWGSDDFSFESAFNLSAIRIDTNDNGDVYSKPAAEELISMMKLYPMEFAMHLLICNVYDHNGKILAFGFSQAFKKEVISLVDDFSLEGWINKYFTDERIKYVLLAIANNNGDFLRVKALKEEYPRGDFDGYYDAIKEDADRKLDADVEKFMKDNIGVDLSMISFDTGKSIPEVKESINRLVDRGVISSWYSNLKETMALFEVGDYVSLTAKTFKKKNDKLIYSNNIFKIDKIDDTGAFPMYKLDGLDATVELHDIEAIPIDGTHDRDIYYDPIIAASVIAPGQPIPMHHADYSYYMDHFKRCTYEEKTYVELVNEANCQFVHEVQHYMREELGGCELKINHRVRTNSI